MMKFGKSICLQRFCLLWAFSLSVCAVYLIPLWNSSAGVISACSCARSFYAIPSETSGGLNWCHATSCFNVAV